MARAAHLVLARGARHLASEVEQSLADVFVFVNRQKAATATLLAMAALPVLALMLSGSVLFALASLPLAWLVPRRVLGWMRARRIRTLERQLPDTLLMMAGALRAGGSFPIALESAVQESVPPISQEFDLLLREIRLGIDLDIAMRNIEKRIPVPDFMMVTAAVTISREVGGNLADALESVARTLQSKLQMEGKIRALTSQGRMQGIVMTCLPLFLMMVLRALEPVAMAPLFTTPIGWGTLAVIAVMEWLGYRSIARIVRIDV
nr:type II secretion system F family protein [Paraburkholderia piptadeniae]